jgi:WD40 repeat protein
MTNLKNSFVNMVNCKKSVVNNITSGKDSQNQGITRAHGNLQTSMFSVMDRPKKIPGKGNSKLSMLDFQKKGLNRHSTEKDKAAKPKNEKGHVDAIMVLLPLPKLQFLASAGLDGKIILWDTIKLKKKREYVGFHQKGVVSLQFNENLIVLISGGIDHKIFIWNPYIGRDI